jgi:hypothetical protein
MMGSIRKDLTGKQFGKLIVLKYLRSTIAGVSIWKCACECGKQVDVYYGNLTQGHSQSCGCFAIDIRKNKALKHGHLINYKQSPEYSSWAHAKSRCCNLKNRDYKNYGGRGIKMCNSWLNSFSNFLLDMGKRPTADHSIDRINNDGNYTPTNCRWATKSIQMTNRRKFKRTRI